MWLRPHAAPTIVKSLSSSNSTGVSDLSVLPVPNWPLSLRPKNKIHSNIVIKKIIKKFKKKLIILMLQCVIMWRTYLFVLTKNYQ